MREFVFFAIGFNIGLFVKLVWLASKAIELPITPDDLAEYWASNQEQTND